MLGFLFFCPFLCCVPMLQISCSENTTVLQLSVPEDHRLCLWCGGSDTSDVVWTHQDRTVLVTRQKNYETNQDRTRFQLKPDASLCLLRLDDADAGTFRCNDRLVTELEVLTGQDFRVSAGRTLLLPCRRSDKPKQRWFQRREGGKREPILTRFKNATVKPERHDPRLSYQHDALQILQLQPGDAGEYLCNGELEATVVVLTQSLSVPTAPPAVTGAVTVEKTKTDKTPETEGGVLDALPPLNETLHYASLGRHSWRERADRTGPGLQQHSVIYSSVLTEQVGPLQEEEGGT
ncbi:uncharacterized protein LOC143013861 isoform X2 [Genypterus blacodes]|uniref:uncharacterized protein LOC143013861 isoform X2 n=1 Tax=Genypterus blacodes TaxID=154954 RepID=UPI003F768B2A